jgi:hypothetical protein
MIFRIVILAASLALGTLLGLWLGPKVHPVVPARPEPPCIKAGLGGVVEIWPASACESRFVAF